MPCTSFDKGCCLMTTFNVRFSLMGAIGLAGLFCIWASGWTDRIIAADVTYIVWIQSLLMLVALYNVWRGEWTHVQDLREMLFELGLIGTLIGMIIAVADVDPTQVGNANAAGKLAAGFISGMGVALYTTLVGAVFAAWLWLLRQILNPIDRRRPRSRT